MSDKAAAVAALSSSSSINASSSRPNAAAVSKDEWTLAIKSVGSISSHLHRNNNNSSNNNSSSLKLPSNNTNNNNNAASNEDTFHISIHPDESLYKLSCRIEEATGLEVERQRLIYRGRILIVDYDDDDVDGNGQGDADGDDEECCVTINGEQGSSNNNSNTNNNHEEEDGDDVVDDDTIDVQTVHPDEEDDEEERNYSDLTCDGTEISSDAAVVEVTVTPPRSREDGDDHTPDTIQEEDNNSMLTQSVSEYISLLQRQQQEQQRRNENGNDDSSVSAAATIPPPISALLNPSINESIVNKQQQKQQQVKKKKLKQRIRDVKGLDDGHTIHLVPRPPPNNNNDNNNNASSTMQSRRGAAESSNNRNNNYYSSNTTDNNNATTTTATTSFSNILGGILTDATTTAINSNTNVTSLSGPEGMNLLTTLLGMSEGGVVSGSEMLSNNTLLNYIDSSPNNGGGIATTTASTTTWNGGTLGSNNSNSIAASRRRARGTTSSRARAAAARLNEADVRARDPGSVEPIRQGLMTLHTLLGNGDVVIGGNNNDDTTTNALEEEGKEEEKMEETNSSEQQQHPIPPSYYTVHQLQFNRQWYRGQWLDALDTVNQWLEATVVDIVMPDDILSGGGGDVTRDLFESGAAATSSSSSRPKRKLRRRTPDAVVSANDLEGRRRLLLEQLSEESQENNDDNDPTNNTTNILDSPTRNIHPIMDAGYRPRNDNEGVQLLLIHYNGWPHRWDEWIRSDSERIRPFRTRTRHRPNTTHLASPTPSNVFQAAPSTHIMDEDDELERVAVLGELHRVVSSVNEVLASVIPFENVTSSQEEEEEDRNNLLFAPSATDTAHLPWTLPNHGMEDTLSSNPFIDMFSDVAAPPTTTPRRRIDPVSRLDSTQLRRLAPLLDRLGRTLTDSALHVACLADALPQPGSEDSPVLTNPLSLLRRVSPPQSSASRSRDRNNTWTTRVNDSVNAEDMEALNDPDISDFINGMVNTTRSANRSDRDRDPLISGLLSNYISSSDNNDTDNNTLGRLIRMGGVTNNGGGRNDNDGPGIDIHIHAVVSGPGMPPPAGGGGGGTTTVASTPLHSILRNGGVSSTSNRELRNLPLALQAMNEEDQGLFSELYTETPTPLNMHGSDNAVNAEETGSCGLKKEVYEECQSIHDDENCDVDESDVSEQDADDIEPRPSVEVRPSASLAAPQDAPSSPPHDSNTSFHTISEIGSVNSSPSPSPSRAAIVNSSSFTNRLFSRTLGRLSRSSNNRRNGGNSS